MTPTTEFSRVQFSERLSNWYKMRKDWLIRSFRAECKGFFVFFKSLKFRKSV